MAQRKKLHKSIHGIGIDVSKKTLAVCIQFQHSQRVHRTINNSVSGISSLAKDLKRQHFNKKIVMESTGKYHVLAAFILSQAGMDVRVINPLQAKKYATSSIRRHKTDTIDASHLAEMAVKEEKLPYPFKMDKKAILLRHKIGFIASMEKQLQTLQAIIKGYKDFVTEFNDELSDAEKRFDESIKTLKKAKNQLENEIEKAVMENQKSEGRERDQEIVQSTSGISRYLACLILTFFSTENTVSPKQWIAFAGLDVAIRQSGQWKGKGVVSKRGSAYLRKRLFCGGWGAIMNDKQFRQWYDRLKNEGRTHKEAVLIVTRKLIRITFSLLKSKQLFDSSKAFSVDSSL